jgi:hypothetical protein
MRIRGDTVIPRYAAGALLIALLAAGPLAAQDQDDECPTWLPDLRCERESRYPGFVPTLSFPYLFEDPFITTGVSVWAIWHDFPESSVFEGGDLRAVSVQVRLALTERLAAVATKDGYYELRPDNDLLDTEKGWGDLAFGLKYALIDRPEDRFILTPSLRYEMTQGSTDVLQGNGEGVWIPGLSMGLGLGEFHTMAAFGAQLPVDGDEESTLLYYNLHVGRQIFDRLVGVLELNGLHYIDDGDGSTRIKTSLGRLPLSVVQSALRTGSFDGLDVANLGSEGVDGNDFISLSFGVQFQLRPGLHLGAAYERPITRRRDIMKQRATLLLVWDL